MTNWINAARLRTLPLSLSGIITGSFLAKWRLDEGGHNWDATVFVLAVVVTLLYQILSNYANDYGDGIKGTDQKRSHLAEQRTVASGKITAGQMKKAVALLAVLSLAATVALLYQAFFRHGFINEFYIFTGLGVLCILAAIGYTVGRKPYGYLGLGDIMVFIFFGLVSVGGSYFLFVREIHWDILLPAAAIGMMSTAVLNMNNMRDIENDRDSGKKTLALQLGYRNAMIYQMVLLQLPLIMILIFLLINKLHETGNYYAFIVMILLFPMAAIRRRMLQTKSPEELDSFLKQIGIMTFMMSVLLTIGLNYF